MNRRNLLAIGSLLVLLCLVVPASADPNFEIQSLSGDLEGHHLGLPLALGQFEIQQSLESLSAFSGKSSGVAEIAGVTFSVLSVPPDCRLDVSSQTTPPTSAPEPATMLLLGTGLAGVAGLMRRHRRIRRHLQSE